jgi:hypothetical protein
VLRELFSSIAVLHWTGQVTAILMIGLGAFGILMLTGVVIMKFCEGVVAFRTESKPATIQDPVRTAIEAVEPVLWQPGREGELEARLRGLGLIEPEVQGILAASIESREYALDNIVEMRRRDKERGPDLPFNDR